MDKYLESKDRAIQRRKQLRQTPWVGDLVHEIFMGRLRLMDSFGGKQVIKFRKGVDLRIEPWLADLSFTHSSFFGPVLRLSVRPLGEFEGKWKLGSYEHIKDVSQTQAGCLGFVSLNFARCGSEKKFTAFIHSFQNRHPFKSLPRASRRLFRHWDDAVLSFLEKRFKEMGVKRIAFLRKEDPLLEELPEGLKEKFYGELPRSHGFKKAKLKVKLVNYLADVKGLPPKPEIKAEELTYQVKEL